MDGEVKESVWFEIFRTGTWHGFEYTKDMLDEMVENFKKDDPRPPLIIGHNSCWGGEEKPAHGWVSSLKRSGNRLMAKARNVSAELTAAVNNEVFPMRSIEVWHDYKGRGYALSSIAFLGGSNPEVGGMADFKFSRNSDEDPGYMMQSSDGKRVCFAYESTERMIAKGDQKQSQHKTTEGGDSSMTKEEIAKLVAEGVAAEIATHRAKVQTEMQELKDQNEQLRSDLSASRKEVVAHSVQADIRDCQAFAKSLFDKRKVRPAVFNAGLGGFLASLDNKEELSFGDQKFTRRAFAKWMLEGQASENSLFEELDGDPERENESVDGQVAAFAKKFALDPKIVQEQFKAASANRSSLNAE